MCVRMERCVRQFSTFQLKLHMSFVIPQTFSLSSFFLLLLSSILTILIGCAAAAAAAMMVAASSQKKNIMSSFFLSLILRNEKRFDRSQVAPKKKTKKTCTVHMVGVAQREHINSIDEPLKDIQNV